MALTAFVLITWFVIFFFILLPKKLSLVENSFVFLSMSIIIINTFTVVGFNFKWITSNNEPQFYLAYLLYRTIIYPFALLVLVNIFYMSNQFILKIVATLSVISFIFLTEILGAKLNVYFYKKWNNWYSITEIVLFSILALVVTKFILYMRQRKQSHANL